MSHVAGMADTEEEEARKATDGSCSREQLMEFPKRSCANEALPLPSSESCPWGLAYSTPSMVVFVRGPAHGSEKEERTTTD